MDDRRVDREGRETARRRRKQPRVQKGNRPLEIITYDEIIARDKANLDIFWLKDEALEDTENLPAPEILAQEIVEQLEAALEEFRSVEAALENGGVVDADT